MKDVSGNNIRATFLRFFEEKKHRIVHSSSLVPANDPTLLFTNAGMNQFKDVFLGAEKRDYSRAATSQKCVRAGGKHNDLENVGFTRRHHTFFEMLGNFSFGDYFKKDAIAFAWELITSPEWFGIPKDNLYVTIFEGTADVGRDDEAEQLWMDVGVPKERIFQYGVKDNFWQMGETGPCGPCSEIFYDMGLEASEHGKDLPFGQDDARYVEIWNLVFMQFDRIIDRYECSEHPERHQASPFLCDKMHANGDFMRGALPVYRLEPLPKPSIDTGMGLERVSAVLQSKLSNFETDLFTPLIERAGELTGLVTGHDFSRAESSPQKDGALAPEGIESLVQNASLRIIADHARAATFLINDGVLPSNEGRGYVLRKILRRGIRHGRLLGQEKPFLFEMVYAVRDEMQGAYPDLIDSADRVAKVIEAEEKQFDRVLKEGSNRLESEIALAVDKVVGSFIGQHAHAIPANAIDHELRQILKTGIQHQRRAEAIKWGIGFLNEYGGSNADVRLDGKTAFFLYETFGLPIDFIADVARDFEVGFDEAGFEAARAEEQSRARASWKGGSQKTASPAYRELPKTIFEGYKQLTSTNSEVLAIVKDGAGVPAAKAGELVDVVLDHTSFYGDSGGQIGDTGVFLSTDGNTTIAEIQGCVLPVQGVRAHRALLKQDLAVGDHVNTAVDGPRRDSIKRNHTGTHLLHAALRQVLGLHVKQAGSLVDSTRLRFDFSHFAQVADE
ncbi:alanine--tRNA ligase, partial [Terracidiphilus sp.]|uniref:alanine--tRNA ligase n=1 Tax=Terracidiphilus sp. TaxID=1964191 RepID=UPI003C25C21D